MKGTRDQALTYGQRQLGDEELLQVIGVSVTVLDRTGGLRAAAAMDPSELSDLIGRRSATKFIAAVELGRRLLASADPRPRLTTPAAIARYLVPSMVGLRREEFRVLCLTARNTLIRDVRVAVGTTDSCPVDPREVFAPALSSRASALVVAHNHPSGDPTPSVPDVQLTRQLRDGAQLLGITLLDHIVVGEAGTYCSMAERRELQS